MKHTPFSPCGTDNILELQPGAPAAPAPTNSVPNPAQPPLPGEVKIVQAPVESPDVPLSHDEGFAAVSEAEAFQMALSPPQRTAIELITSGHTLVAAATAAGVSRMTLYRWLKGDAAFTAAFNAWQKDVLDTARGRLLALSDLAVSTVAKSMSCGDAKTALKVLQSIGALDRPQPGSTDPQEIQRMQDLETRKTKTALRKAEARAEMESFEPL